MDSWHVTLRTIRPPGDDDGVTDEVIVAAQTLLVDHVGHIAVAGRGRGYTMRLYVNADSVAAACVDAVRILDSVRIAAGLPSWSISDLYACLQFRQEQADSCPRPGLASVWS